MFTDANLWHRSIFISVGLSNSATTKTGLARARFWLSLKKQDRAADAIVDCSQIGGTKIYHYLILRLGDQCADQYK